MKNLLFIVLLIFAFIATHAQYIDGIGVVKLGETEQGVLSNLKIDSKKIVEGATQKKKNISKVLEHSVVRFKYDPTCTLVKDLLTDSQIESYFEKCPDVVIYNIPEYPFAGTFLKNFKLYFYKDTLIKIFTDDRLANVEFIRVFEAKHGEGTITSSDSHPDKNSPGNSAGYTITSWASDSSKNIAVNLFKSHGYSKEINQYGMETGEVEFREGFSFEIQKAYMFNEFNELVICK